MQPMSEGIPSVWIPSVCLKETGHPYGRTGTEVPPSRVRIGSFQYGRNTDEADAYGRQWNGTATAKKEQ